MHYSVFSNNKPAPLSIYSIGFSRDKKVNRFGPGRRNSYIIHYVTKGKGYYNGNLVSAGQGFLIFPGQNEEYHADEKEPWEFLWVISNDDRIKEFLNRYKADLTTQIFDYNTCYDIEKIANALVPKKNFILDSLEVLEMFLHIFNSHSLSKKSLKHKSNEHEYIDFCLDYIQTNIYKKITVDELTKFIGVSQPYLYKIFMKHFNMSVKDYIIWNKIYNAKKMLEQTDMTVTQIAISLGYDDPLAFSRIFSQKEGISPSKYRQIHTRLQTPNK